ncbi:MAG: amidohydrolase family protein [Candidatus Hodarchaeota archaeon]
MKSQIIDFHCHLKDGKFEHLLKVQASHGVQMSIIHPAFKEFDALDAYHEDASRACGKHPDKLGCFIGINFSKDPESIASDFNALEGALGVKIHPLLQEIQINDKEFMAPYMAVIKKLDVPVYVHTDHPGVPDYQKYRNLLKSKFGRFAKNFPEHDRIIAGHAGNNDNYLVMKEVLKLRKNVYVETSLAPVPTEFEKMVKRIEGGEDKVLFGSNMPYCSIDVELKKIEILNISSEQKNKILQINARRVLKL